MEHGRHAAEPGQARIIVALAVGLIADVRSRRVDVVDLGSDAVDLRPLVVVGRAAGQGQRRIEIARRACERPIEPRARGEQASRRRRLVGRAQPDRLIEQQPAVAARGRVERRGLGGGIGRSGLQGEARLKERPPDGGSPGQGPRRALAVAIAEQDVHPLIVVARGEAAAEGAEQALLELDRHDAGGPGAARRGPRLVGPAAGLQREGHLGVAGRGQRRKDGEEAKRLARRHRFGRGALLGGAAHRGLARPAAVREQEAGIG